MPFGFGNNTAPSTISGFRSGQANQGWNPWSSARNGLTGIVNREIPYSTVFAGFINASQRISTFDFNQTDEELKRLLESHNTTMASALGALTGRSIGKALAIGGAGLAGITVPKIRSTALAKRLIEATTEEAREEIVEEVRSLFQITSSIFANRLLIEGYMKVRSFIKKQPLVVLERFFDPATARYIKNTWGEPDAPELIISEAIEERIEQIPNAMMRIFVEEAIEEGYDAFIESGFVIANELDQALAEFQLRQSEPEETITIETIAGEPDAEVIVIENQKEETIIEQAQTAITNWRLLQNRDIGNIVTSSVELVRSNPQSRKLEITFASVSTPPFVSRNNIPFHQTTITIPNIKRNISWDRLKRTLRYNRNIPAYTWGDSKARAYFKDKRMIKINYDPLNMTQQAIKEYLEELAELSDSELQGISASNILEQPTRDKDTGIGMYPIEGRLITRNLFNLQSGNVNSVPQDIYRFPIWTNGEQSDFTSEFNQVDL